MKKTPVVAINLRFMRIPFLLCLFLLSVIISVIACRSAPPFSLSREVVDALICSSSAFKNPDVNVCGVFSLLEKAEKEASVPSAEKKSEVTALPSSQEENVNILTRTPKSVNSLSKVEISNSTNHAININDYIGAAPDFLSEDFSVLIVHTHTTESYTPSEKYSYTPTDTDRTQDKNYNMVRVGDEIEKILKENNIKVYHDTTINDYPSYNGSYNRSSANVSNFIKNDSSIKIVLDVHRDAIEGSGGEKVKYTSDIEGKKAASVMLVVGSNLSGLKHDSWETNMRFALQLQQHTQSLYPGLCRPINFRSQRFNQQLAPGAIIVEVGTNGNTLDEALLGARYFAKSLADFLRK